MKKKLKQITNLLKSLVGDKIQFIGDSNYYKLIDEVSTCIVKDEKTCNKSPNLCAITENGKCRLILPRKSLIAFDKTKKEYKAKFFPAHIGLHQIPGAEWTR